MIQWDNKTKYLGHYYTRNEIQNKHRPGRNLGGVGEVEAGSEQVLPILMNF